jgi:hypothetical protein
MKNYKEGRDTRIRGDMDERSEREEEKEVGSEEIK